MKSEIVCIKHPYLDISMYVDIKEKPKHPEIFIVWISGYHLVVKSPDLESLVLAFIQMTLDEMVTGDSFMYTEENYTFLLENYSTGYKDKELIKEYWSKFDEKLA